ncbi:MAG: Outer rane efflux protein [Schlesneria sp.]|nr:Outer rane efflux protein [Schlesneria sp.]
MRASRDAVARRSAADSAVASKPAIASAKSKLAPKHRSESTPATSGPHEDDGSEDAIIQTSATTNDEPLIAATSQSAELTEDYDPQGSQTATQQPPAPYPLNLGDILHLADAQNPNVAFARERINEAYARVDRAEALWLPSLRTGLNYNHHEGAIQSVAGDVFQTNRSAFGGGLGAGMYGAASPTVPGLIAQFHLSDAIFQPKIAAHQAASRQFGAIAARNDVLRDAAVGYLELVRAEQGMVIAKVALDNTQKLTELTRQYAETGQGLQADHQRMEAELALRSDGVVNQQEQIQVASARLAQLLHADPSVQIATNEPVVTSLDIMTVEGTAASYVVLGLSRRPELSEQKHLVCEAVQRLNREKYAPLIPSVLLGMSYGGMGGGLGNNIVNSNQRWDADAVAYWELRNLGFGDQAARGETASAARQAQIRELAILDRVAREVVEAHTQVVQRKQRLEIAKKGIVAAERSYDLNQQRIANAQGLPIEVLQSIQALANAQKTYLNAVIDYNIAQFELSRATGWFVES